ncbi:hypothetical protein T439DRAFT_383081 [Meredithblackwellia eburnea MCA 4105]
MEDLYFSTGDVVGSYWHEIDLGERSGRDSMSSFASTTPSTPPTTPPTSPTGDIKQLDLAPHPRIIPPALLPVIKANIVYPDARPPVIRWSRELEDLFRLLSWEEWWELVELNVKDLETLKSKESSWNEVNEATRSYERRMDDVLSVYFARLSYAEEEQGLGISPERQHSRLARFRYDYMTTRIERDEMEERCLNPPPRLCTPPPIVGVIPATPLGTKGADVAPPPDPKYLFAVPLDFNADVDEFEPPSQPAPIGSPPVDDFTPEWLQKCGITWDPNSIDANEPI